MSVTVESRFLKFNHSKQDLGTTVYDLFKLLIKVFMW